MDLIVSASDHCLSFYFTKARTESYDVFAYIVFMKDFSESVSVKNVTAIANMLLKAELSRNQS